MSGTVKILAFATISIASVAVLRAELQDECQSEVKENEASVGSMLMATGTSTLLSTISLRDDPFADLEDTFDAGTSTILSTISPRDDPFADLEDTFDASASRPSPSVSGDSDFWFIGKQAVRAIKALVVYPALFILVPLAVSALFEARSRILKRRIQSGNTSPAPFQTQQHTIVNWMSLLEAGRSGDEARWRQVLESIPHVARAVDCFGRTALHAAAGVPCAEMAAALVTEHGADVNVKDMWEETPLHFAARSGSIDVCSLFLANGADANALSIDGVSPLLAAAKAGNESTRQMLLDKGASFGDAQNSELPPPPAHRLVQALQK